MTQWLGSEVYELKNRGSHSSAYAMGKKLHCMDFYCETVQVWLKTYVHILGDLDLEPLF